MRNKHGTGFLVMVVANLTLTVGHGQGAPTHTRPDPTDIHVIGRTVDRSSVIQSQALDNPAMALTNAQRVEINRIVDTYLEEQRKVDAKFPLTQGARPTAEAILARQAVIVAMNTAVTKALDARQLKAWRDGLAAQRKPRDITQMRPSGR